MTTLSSQLQLVKAGSRGLGMAAVVLGLSALVHTVVLVLSGGDWRGAVSFRKPITFAISVGFILWTSAWIMDPPSASTLQTTPSRPTSRGDPRRDRHPPPVQPVAAAYESGLVR